jgi:hypothetical protein
MVAYLRQFLVLLLVLLQFAAPLVHAHVDDIGPVRGLHLHEFETLHIQQDFLSLTTSESIAGLDYTIVELGQLIEIQQQADDFSPVYYLYSDERLLVSQQMSETVNFSPQALVMLAEPFLSQNLTRAPPAL